MINFLFSLLKMSIVQNILLGCITAICIANLAMNGVLVARPSPSSSSPPSSPSPLLAPGSEHTTACYAVELLNMTFNFVLTVKSCREIQISSGCDAYDAALVTVVYPYSTCYGCTSEWAREHNHISTMTYDQYWTGPPWYADWDCSYHGDLPDVENCVCDHIEMYGYNSQNEWVSVGLSSQFEGLYGPNITFSYNVSTEQITNKEVVLSNGSIVDGSSLRWLHNYTEHRIMSFQSNVNFPLGAKYTVRFIKSWLPYMQCAHAGMIDASAYDNEFHVYGRFNGSTEKTMQTIWAAPRKQECTEAQLSSIATTVASR